MKVTRRAFLKGIVATGAAAAVPAFIIRREPEPMVDLDVSTVFDEVSDGDPLGFFMPREGGENFSNLFDPSRATTLTRENFRRAIAEMKLQHREPIRPHVVILPPKLYAEYRQFFS